MCNPFDLQMTQDHERFSPPRISKQPCYVDVVNYDKRLRQRFILWRGRTSVWGPSFYGGGIIITVLIYHLPLLLTNTKWPPIKVSPAHKNLAPYGCLTDGVRVRNVI